MIEILTSGALNTVQDLGRPGYLSIGVSTGGAMDRLALSIGNCLLGNPANSAGLEIAFFPFRLKLHADCRLAITGADCDARLDQRAIAPGWACNAKASQVLSLLPPKRGARCYLTFSGGLDVPPVLDSCSTDLKTGFGGLQGRGLLRGDRLAVAAPAAARRAEFGTALTMAFAERGAEVEVRVLPGAELEEFDESSRQAFFSQPWVVTQDANRMGMRLQGEPLRLAQPREMLSHGILPGTVQVPPSGQPIIQLADANTCGGYPKIAHVIDADLWRLAQVPAGTPLRFVPVDQEQAVAAQDALERQLVRLRQSVSYVLGAFTNFPASAYL